MYGAFSANLNNPIFEEDDFRKLLLMIRGALANNSQDMAVDYLLVLNEMLMERNEKPLSIEDILFINFDLFVSRGDVNAKKQINLVSNKSQKDHA